MNKVVVIGVGYFGSDCQNQLKKYVTNDIPFIAVDTNSRNLEKSTASASIVLEKNAPQSIQRNEKLKQVFQEFETIIFLSSLSEDTDNNVLVPLVEYAKSNGNHVVNLTTIPFQWEVEKGTGASILQKIETLYNTCDASGFYDNNATKPYLQTLSYKPSLTEAMNMMNDFMCQSVSNILDLPSFDTSKVISYIEEQTDILNNLLEQAQ